MQLAAHSWISSMSCKCVPLIFQEVQASVCKAWQKLLLSSVDRLGVLASVCTVRQRLLLSCAGK